VRCFYGKNLNRERNFWTDFPTFLSTEIERISALYSPEGIRSCPDEFTLPTRSN
jgi:hypothetical protein